MHITNCSAKQSKLLRMNSLPANNKHGSVMAAPADFDHPIEAINYRLRSGHSRPAFLHIIVQFFCIQRYHHLWFMDRSLTRCKIAVLHISTGRDQ
jgi:hypothetical protein